MPKSIHDATSGLRGLESLAWATDTTLPLLTHRAFQTIISNNDDRPLILVVQEVLSHKDFYRKRREIITGVKIQLLEYYQERYVEEDTLKQYENELDSLAYYWKIIKEKISHSDSLNKFYSEHPDNIPRVDSVFFHHLVLTDSYYQDDFIWYSQVYYNFTHIDNSFRFDANTLPAYLKLFEFRIVTPTAIDFCRSLLETESFRRVTLDEKKDVPATVKDFSVILRNYCFEKYIRLKGEEERQILLRNNERDEQPSIIEGERELLKKETKNYKIALAKNEDAEIMKMARYFIRYLRRDLGYENPTEDEIDPNSEEYTIPNENNDIERRIKAVYKKDICKHQADWGAVMRLLIEKDECSDTDYAAVALRINKACGKNVTTASSLKQSHALTDISGTWQEGWKDAARTRQSAKLLLRFKEIARTFLK